MATIWGPNIITDGLVLSLDAANVESYAPAGTIPKKSESIASAWTDSGGSQAYYTVIGDDDITLTSGTGWYGYFQSTVATTGYYTVAFEYSNDTPGSEASNFVIDNDGIMNNTYNTSLQATTTVQTFTKTVNVTSTGTSQMFIRRTGAGNIKVRNYRFYKSDSAGNSLVWHDVSGNGIDMDVKGSPSFSTNNSGYFHLDGVDDRVISDNHSIISDIRGDFSVGMWLKFGGTSSSHHIPFWISDSNGNGFVYIELGSNYGYLGVATETKARNGYVSGANINDNNWHYIVVTRSTGASVVIYKDGTSQTVTTQDMYGSWNIGSGGDMSVGVGMDNGSIYSSSYYEGNCSFITTYNRVITATEVLQNYNAHKARYGL